MHTLDIRCHVIPTSCGVQDGQGLCPLLGARVAQPGPPRLASACSAVWGDSASQVTGSRWWCPQSPMQPPEGQRAGAQKL